MGSRVWMEVGPTAALEAVTPEEDVVVSSTICWLEEHCVMREVREGEGHPVAQNMRSRTLEELAVLEERSKAEVADLWSTLGMFSMQGRGLEVKASETPSVLGVLREVLGLVVRKVTTGTPAVRME